MNRNWCYIFPNKSLHRAYSTLKHSLNLFGASKYNDFWCTYYGVSLDPKTP